MDKAVSAMASVAVLAASLMFTIPKLVNASAPEPGQKADFADLGDCDLGNWPYYTRACVRDETRNAGRSISVRLVAPDRISDFEIRAASGPAPIRLSRAALVEAASPIPLASLVAPSSWMMSYSEAKLNLDAGDFIRRTVR
jgi:hypothetical protein